MVNTAAQSREPELVTIDCFGLTDIGKVREVNEDQFLIADLGESLLIHQTSLSHEDETQWFGGARGRLFVVADGMGGHAAGQHASSIAIDTLAHYVLEVLPRIFRPGAAREEELEKGLGTALERCQQQIEHVAERERAWAGMGTTLTMAYILWPKLYVVHAGDSRCYLMRGDKLEQLTMDHTLAQEFVNQGALTPEQAAESRFSHVLWNCIGGGSSDLRPEVRSTTLSAGDSLLLCTDGLSKYIGDDELAKVMRANAPAEAKCATLVSAANEAGGKDNITVVLADFKTR
jgi:protein phosphatase